MQCLAQANSGDLHGGREGIGSRDSGRWVAGPAGRRPLRLRNSYLWLWFGLLCGKSARRALIVCLGGRRDRFVGPNLLLMASALFWCAFRIDDSRLTAGSTRTRPAR